MRQFERSGDILFGGHVRKEVEALEHQRGTAPTQTRAAILAQRRQIDPE